MLKCPVDRVELVEQPVGSTGFASCPDCGGLWLPRTARMELVDPERISSTSRRVPEQSARPRKYRLCPQCKISLSSERIEGIEVDRCITCDGIWLDAGEYDAVRHRIAVENPANLQEERDVIGAGPLEIIVQVILELLQLLP